MKSKRNIFPVAVLSLAALCGCAASSDEADVDEGPELAEDELILRRGPVDHAAIVEVTTMMLAPGPVDGLLDPYNQADPFSIRSATYAQRFADRLRMFDAQDGETNWAPEQARAWVARISAGNYQVVDTTKPCDFDNPHTYLEIERARLTKRPHETCGGRMPNEDALDVTVNFLIRGPAASVDDKDALHDGVNQATRKSVPTFPYLAEMNGL
jgi:hypothetical protein